MARKLFLLPLVILLGFTFHKYYVSITEAEYNMSSKTIEISVKFIGHDLEKALKDAGIPELNLGTSNESDKANHYLKKYIEKHLLIKADGNELDYTFIGKEVNNDDFIYCYIETNQLEKPKEVEIKNTLLIEVFNEQVNTVYLKVGQTKQTYTFNKGKVRETHTIH